MGRSGELIRSAAILARWVARATGSDLLRHLVPQWTLGFLLVVELDVIVDFREVARTASALPPSAAALALTLVCAVTTLGARRIVADLWLGPRHAVLRRQPLSGPSWGPASVVVLGPALAPLGFAALVWYGGTAVPAALTWLGAGLVPAVLIAGRQWLAWLVASAAVGAIAAVGQAHPQLYLALAPLVWAVAVPLAGICTVRLVSWSTDAVGRSPRRPRSPLEALLQRDALAVWRLDRRLVLAAIGAAAPTAFVVGAMSVNGEYPGPTLTVGALVSLAFVGPLVLQAATIVARALGRRLDPPEWPVTAAQRALSLSLVAAGMLAPGWAAAAVAGPPIGVAGHLRIASFVAALGAGAAWWVVSRPGRPNAGSWPYWIAVCLGAALVPWTGLVGIGLAALAFGSAVRGLEQRRGRT